MAEINRQWMTLQEWLKMKKSEKIQDGGFQSGEDLKKYKLKHTQLSGLFTAF
jgi:hypothetical protein